MYLYVFVFIILSILSIYTELFSMRVARINEQQTTPATVMYTWHNGVYKYTKLKYDAGNSSSTCSITYKNPIAMIPRCKGVSPATSVFLNAKSETLSPSPTNYLPVDSNWTFLRDQFFSYVFNDAKGTRLITFVENDGSRSMGIDASQMMRQIVKLSYPAISYGAVADKKCDGTAGRKIETKAFFTKAGGTRIKPCFDVPDDIAIGSVGIVSYL